MSELERRLTQLGRELDWPPTPELAPAVSARLRAEADASAPAGFAPDARAAPGRRSRFVPAASRFRRSLAIALASLLVLAGGVFAAVPDVRDAVLDFFGLRGATIERRQQLPPAPDLAPLRLGERTTLASARESLDFEPLLPRAGAPPDGVYVDEGVPGGRLSLAYRARTGLPEARSTGLGLLVDQFRGDLSPEYGAKIAGQATVIERFRLDGERAIWLEGAPHFFFYRSPDEPLREDQLRIAQNVLLLEHGRLLVRLEGAFGRERAVALARSLR
jgi:hypothetical protein